jgi:putative acetyltransferase
MNTDVVIRSERADHPQVVAALAALDAYLASLYEPEANHILSIEELLAPDVSFLAAWRGDQVVATGAVRRKAGMDYGEVKRMYVEPALRGQRIGSRLLSALEAVMRSQNLTLARLETGAAQHEALRLYERCGYVRCSSFGGYPDNGLSLFLEKRL